MFYIFAFVLSTPTPPDWYCVVFLVEPPRVAALTCKTAAPCKHQRSKTQSNAKHTRSAPSRTCYRWMVFQCTVHPTLHDQYVSFATQGKPSKVWIAREEKRLSRASQGLSQKARCNQCEYRRLCRLRCWLLVNVVKPSNDAYVYRCCAARLRSATRMSFTMPWNAHQPPMAFMWHGKWCASVC